MGATIHKAHGIPTVSFLLEKCHHRLIKQRKLVRQSLGDVLLKCKFQPSDDATESVPFSIPPTISSLPNSRSVFHLSLLFFPQLSHSTKLCPPSCVLPRPFPLLPPPFSHPYPFTLVPSPSLFCPISSPSSFASFSLKWLSHLHPPPPKQLPTGSFTSGCSYSSMSYQLLRGGTLTRAIAIGYHCFRQSKSGATCLPVSSSPS